MICSHCSRLFRQAKLPDLEGDILKKYRLSRILCIALLFCVPTIIAAKALEYEETIQVASFATLLEALEGGQNVAIQLVSDIEVTDDLLLLPSPLENREIMIDLNGYTLLFKDGTTMTIGEIPTYPNVCVTLTDGNKGGSIVFHSDSREIWHGCIDNYGILILDGDISIRASGTSLKRHYGLIVTTEDAIFIMNAGTISAVGQRDAVSVFSGQMIINGGVILQEGDNAVAIENWGGEVQLNGGVVRASGTHSIAITNEDTFVPLAPPVGSEANLHPPPVPDRDTFVMTGGSVYASGENAIAITAQKNCAVIAGTISASGVGSVGVVYHYAGGANQNETLNIAFTGGKITGEGNAFIDRSGRKAWYRNSLGEAVIVPPGVKELRPGYVDIIAGSWYASSMYSLLDRNIIHGYPDGTIQPDSCIVKSEMAAILANYAGEDLTIGNLGDIHFIDVPQDEWCYLAVAWGIANHIVTAYDENIFGIVNPVNREQFVTALYRYAIYKGIPTNTGDPSLLQRFSDAESVAERAVPAMQWALNTGILQADDNNRLNPKLIITRAEAAVLLMRL
jgi:hypothetical protein